MLAVVKIHQHTLTVGTAVGVGTAVTADSWDEAYETAQEFVCSELEARGIDISGDPKTLLDIGDLIREDNYYFVSSLEFGGDPNQDVTVQIIQIEPNMTHANPLYESVFQWSSFTPQFFGGGTDFPREKSEYTCPQMADDCIKIEDGEIAWDTPEKYPMHKKLFGIYGMFSTNGCSLTADVWDKNRTDLIGAATIKNWEWAEYVGGWDEEEESDTENAFTDENVLQRLQCEVEEIQEWLNRAD